MARQVAWILAAALAVGAPANALAQPGRDQRNGGSSTGSQDPNRWKWWMNPDDRRELGITDQQSAAIEQIWASVAPQQREKWHELQRLQGELEQTLKAATMDSAAVAQQVEQVEKLRAAINGTRTIMLYRMSQVLTPDQRVKLEAHRARREENRRRQGDKDRPEH
ncbi:MAG TPA: periplasmic heavy metal sensor [Vicinamibacterales bacterium]|nr:periplasmic heavy metal sensor [Vicinamibacterales bacterium]